MQPDFAWFSMMTQISAMCWDVQALGRPWQEESTPWSKRKAGRNCKEDSKGWQANVKSSKKSRKTIRDHMIESVWDLDVILSTSPRATVMWSIMIFVSFLESFRSAYQKLESVFWQSLHLSFVLMRHFLLVNIVQALMCFSNSLSAMSHIREFGAQQSLLCFHPAMSEQSRKELLNSAVIVFAAKDYGKYSEIVPKQRGHDTLISLNSIAFVQNST